MYKNNYEFFPKYFSLIAALVVAPFIIFLGKNYLQTEFFTFRYFLGIFYYSLLFTLILVFVHFVSKKNLVFLLFLAYFSFLQFYFFDIEKLFLVFFSYGTTKYYVLFFIISLSFIAAFISRFSIFRNFFLILLLLNIIISAGKFIPNSGNSLKDIFKTTTVNDELSKI